MDIFHLQLIDDDWSRGGVSPCSCYVLRYDIVRHQTLRLRTWCIAHRSLWNVDLFRPTSKLHACALTGRHFCGTLPSRTANVCVVFRVVLQCFMACFLLQDHVEWLPMGTCLGYKRYWSSCTPSKLKLQTAAILDYLNKAGASGVEFCQPAAVKTVSPTYFLRKNLDKAKCYSVVRVLKQLLQIRWRKSRNKVQHRTWNNCAAIQWPRDLDLWRSDGHPHPLRHQNVMT